MLVYSKTWRFKKRNPWDRGTVFHFCGFSKTKLIRKLSSTWLHDRNYMHCQQRHFINFIFFYIYILLQNLFFLFKPDYFHYKLYTLNIPVTCSHNIVMAHTPAQISIYLWLNMEASEQRLFLFCTIHVQYRVPFKKKKIFFHKRWLCSNPKLKG